MRKPHLVAKWLKIVFLKQVVKALQGRGKHHGWCLLAYYLMVFRYKQ